MISFPYIITCLLISMAPGPSFAVMLNQSLRNGRVAGMATVLGNTTGLLVWAVASVLGLTALIRTSEIAFVVLKVAGALYLCWLGIRSLIRSRSTAKEAPVEAIRSGLLVAYRSGLVTNLANPKAAVLYLALIPQFLPPGGNPARDTAVLAAVQMAISMAWYTVVVIAFSFVRKTLSKPSVKARVEQVSGLVLVGLGIRMVTLTRASL